MSQLNYLAIMCENPEQMQIWYQRWFGFEELNRTQAGAIYLTDGHFNMGLLKQGAPVGEDHQELGVHHLGFQIESILEVERNLEDFDSSIRIERRPRDDPYAEYRIVDPEGLIVDLSEKGYGIEGDPREPGIRHIATCNRGIPRKFAFYTQVLGMRDAKRSQAEVEEGLRHSTGTVPEGFQYSTPSHFGGDGFINLALLSEPRAGEIDNGSRKMGFDHFGILIRNPLNVVREMGQAGGDGRPSDVRPAARMVEYGVQDPEGNRIDLSGGKGWKVDVDKWAQIRG